ncbi:hypothetical protein GQX73_g8262 [Xylaria multiplex]|uniref:Homeobox domain-containing protein n=1 Tax=Xylaria multiplex TaxID=323545 RepID=A0A7C8IN29_9PEZI|nr:hypothetical protein GQX73_g8262 [Xylaria multiplex]
MYAVVSGHRWQDSCPDPTNRILQEKTTLPPIHQVIPELKLDPQRDGVARTPPSAISPTGAQFGGTTTPPEYVHSPNRYKRRRLSIDGDRELDRANHIPRLYTDLSSQGSSRPQSPTPKSRSGHSQWSDSDRPSSYARSAGIPSIISPTAIETRERTEARPTLPGLPSLHFERGVGEVYRRAGYASDEYIPESSRRSSLVSIGGHCTADLGGQAYRPASSFAYGYHHPPRLQSLSMGSAHLDRTPFSPVPYAPRFQDAFMRIGDYGMSTSGDGKQRKRRGNLPKETTDKLRAWFVAHLHHPYPTEDEKQDLMRQTGLQMNQISNWFINARRRQLPAMINNARAESDRMNSHTVDSSKSTLSSSERIDYDTDVKHQSDSESSNFEDLEMEPTKRHRTTDLKRGSV